MSIEFDNSVVCANSIEWIKKIEDCSVHAIISDIPYGIGYDEWDVLHSNSNSAYGGQSEAQAKSGLFKRRGKPLNGWSEADRRIPKEYQDWVSKWAKEWMRVLKPGGSVFVFAGRQFSHRVITAFEDIGMTYKDMLAWERDKAAHRAQHLSSIYDRRKDITNSEKWKGWRVANLRPLFEPILWFQKPYKIGGTIADNVLQYEVGAWNEEALRNWNTYQDAKQQSNMIKVTVTSKDRGLHPTQKPLALMKLLIELSTCKGQKVLDPFSGSGTTILACKELGRKGLGIESNPEYVKVANERIQDSPETLF